MVVRELLDHKGLGKRVGDGSGFLHDVLKVTSNLKVRPCRGPERGLKNGLDVHGSTTHLRPGETHGNTRRTDLVETVRGEDRWADVVSQVILANNNVNRVRNLESLARLLRSGASLVRAGPLSLLAFCGSLHLALLLGLLKSRFAFLGSGGSQSGTSSKPESYDQTVVIFIQDLDSVRNAKVLGTPPAPGDLGEPIEIVSCHVELGGSGFKMSKLVKLLIKDFAYSFRHGKAVCLFLELFDKLIFAVRLKAKFTADTLHLLHKPVLSLSLANLILHILANLGLQLGVHKLFLEYHESLLHSLLNI
ncbi:hypothetical protein HG531_006277 [Fusarium graminearum]|nr:hypothetical protein HG531_006277 [Fusarium graminearum]